MYVFVDPTTNTIVQLDRNSYIVEFTPALGRTYVPVDFIEAADNPQMAAIPVIEHLESAVE